MLTEDEKQELKELAVSAAVRDEFRLLRKNSLAFQCADVDQFIRFLTAMARLSPTTAASRAFVPYAQVKI
ncbi:MAG: hypothetical protein HYT78_15380 [Deltaproteobacteria bacterium]|nr:hypothetical protein [Deltaproteobacteria bacterium]